MQFGEQRHHFLLDGIVKCEAVIRRVVEATLTAMGEVAVIRKAGVGAHLVAPLGQVVELGVDGFGLFETSVGGEPPRFLPPGAVGFFEITAHLHEGSFFAVELYGKAADEFLVLLAKLGRLCFERDIFGPEQFDLERGVAGEHPVALGRKSVAVRMIGERLGQAEAALLLLRLDFLDETEVILLGGFIVRLAGHRDVALGAFLGDGGGEFLPVEYGLLELGGIGGGAELLLELVEERRDRGPVAGVQVGRHERARRVEGYFFKHEILFFEHEQQRALPVGTDATKMDVILWAKFLDEIFADGDAVILDEDVADGHVRRAGEQLVENRRLGGFGVHLEQTEGSFSRLSSSLSFFVTMSSPPKSFPHWLKVKDPVRRSGP